MDNHDEKFSIVNLFNANTFDGKKIHDFVKTITDELCKTKFDDNPAISGMDKDSNLTWTIKVYLAENLEKKLCFSYTDLKEAVKIDKEIADKHLEKYKWEFKKWIDNEMEKNGQITR